MERRVKFPILDELQLQELGAKIHKATGTTILPSNESPWLLITGQIPRATSFEKGFPFQYAEDANDEKNLVSDTLVKEYQAIVAWFENVKKRKDLINCADNKLLAAVNLIKEKHPNQRIMVFSETIESIEKLKQLLQNEGIRSMVIDSKLRSKERQKIISEWGKEFFALLSVHTLEIGYDVPDVGIAIILATTSNIHQIVQRIGRTVRKTKEKETALIYTIYLSKTHDANSLKIVRQATDMSKEGKQENHNEISRSHISKSDYSNSSLDK
jgi:superfamily II DNA or RNA helicase